MINLYFKQLALIKLHEGLRLKVYDDATGKPLKPGDTIKGNPTIGYGINLVVGITKAEAEELVDGRLLRLQEEIEKRCPEIFQSLPWSPEGEVRWTVLLDLAYSHGIVGMLKYKKMLASMRKQDWEMAATHLLDSQFGRTHKSRAKRLAGMLRSGKWPAELGV